MAEYNCNLRVHRKSIESEIHDDAANKTKLRIEL